MGKKNRPGNRGRPSPAVGRQLDKEAVRHPRKRMYRARAHCNPLNDASFGAPAHPGDIDWSEHYPAFFKEQQQQQQQGGSSSTAEQPMVRFADVGCGFGGLLIKLAAVYPDTLMLGMEIRDKVTEYVRERILALRRENEAAGKYLNASVLRANAMKYIANYFRKGQLAKMFFLFPDPHFKVANHRRRIINTSLITEYAYVLAPGGMLYTITDVQELGEWMRAKLAAHPLFEQVPDEELEADPAAQLLTTSSEEGQKVARNSGSTYRAVFRRRATPREH